jgi:hypothetical protein
VVSASLVEWTSGFRDRRLSPRDVDSEEPLLVLRVMNNSNLLPADTGFGDAALRMAVAAYLARYRVSLDSTPNLTFAAFCRGAATTASTHSRRGDRMWSSTLRWMQEVQRFQPSTVSVGSRSYPASTGP